MKAKVLSVVIPALLMASAAHSAEIYNKNANKLDLYGKVDGLRYFSSDPGDNGDQTYARLGFKGETQISSQLTGFGTWESQFNASKVENENSIVTRYAYAGLRFGNFGSLNYGRNDGVVYDVTSYTDVLPEFGGDTYGSDNYMQGRIIGALTYRNDNFFGLVDGLSFALQYQGKNNPDDVLKQNGDGFAASLQYEIGGSGLTLGAALSSSARTAAQNVVSPPALYGQGGRAETYSAGIKYNAHQVYAAVHYTQTYNATRFGDKDKKAYGFANKASNFEAVVQYTFDFGLVPSLAYLQSRGSDLYNNAGTVDYGSQNLLKYVEVGATYYFNKNMSTYVDYKINLLKENEFTKAAGIGKDNIVGIGLVYQF